MEIKQKPIFYLSIIIFVYVLFSFLAPILSSIGYVNISNRIYQVYELFCHQRVERSLFLFGDKSFYTVAELKEISYLPKDSTSGQYPEYYGHDFNGNEVIGYKVAICIRDVALYLSFGLTLLLISFQSKVKVKWQYVFILVAPIFIDVGTQMVFEKMRLGGEFLNFINNVDKRIITGFFAGIGCALGLGNIIGNSLTNGIKKGDNER